MDNLNNIIPSNKKYRDVILQEEGYNSIKTSSGLIIVVCGTVLGLGHQDVITTQKMIL
jgi:hypothetical protein